jgi:tripartite-type tricarboxylate transporter receptor subunit TctC
MAQRFGDAGFKPGCDIIMIMKSAGAALPLLVLVAGPVLAAYPERPIRLIVSSPPAGTSDVLGRPVTQKLAESMGRQIVIDNRAGASGNIGVEIVARAAPDGYTLLLGQTQTLAVNPTLYKNLPFDPLRDFAPVAMIGSVVFLLVATPSLSAATVPELVKLAKSKPGQITFGSASPGAVSHLTGEMFKLAAGIDIVHVPYKGAAPAMTDLIGGQISMMFAGGPSATGQIKAGRVKLIAVTGAERLSSFPNVPTMTETGLAGFDARAWWCVVAPAHTPAAVVARLNEEINRALASPDVRERFASQGAEATLMTPAQLGTFIKAEVGKWARVVRESGARAE